MEHKSSSQENFATRSIHAGHDRDPLAGALATPIYQTSTFIFASADQGGRRFAGEEQGYIYTRLGNPTVTQLEQKMANLEGTEACVAAASGMGAISSALWSALQAGDHVVADETLYGCTYSLLCHGLTRYGVEVSFVDCSQPENVRAAMRPNTKVVYLETPANPTMKVTDIAAIASIAHSQPGVMVFVDNTFLSPYLQRPVEHGADVVVHSATKYLNGHGDVIAGFVCGSAEFLNQVRMFGVKDMTGSVLSPFDAYLIIRGLKTLVVRLDRHCTNAQKIAEFLEAHSAVAKVNYPGLPSHPQHELAKRQMHKFGGMLSFELKGGLDAGKKLMNSLQICSLAVSLGDTETLVEHPASMTHSTYTPEERAAAGIPEGLVRLSVGLECVEDIIGDLKQGLDRL